MPRNYRLVLCELFHPEIHGFCHNDSSEDINGHYMTIHSVKYDNELWSDHGESYDGDGEHGDGDDGDDDEYSIFTDILDLYKAKYHLYTSHNTMNPHPIIRNYNMIISKSNYIKPEIAKIEILPGNESICIIKTFWLRIVQRMWKKTFAERKRILEKRILPQSLYVRQLTGKWPRDCSILPGINGMMTIV